MQQVDTASQIRQVEALLFIDSRMQRRIDTIAIESAITHRFVFSFLYSSPVDAPTASHHTHASKILHWGHALLTLVTCRNPESPLPYAGNS